MLSTDICANGTRWTDRIDGARERYDGRIEEDAQQLQESVEVEEEDHFFTPYSSILAANVVNHDCSHDEGRDVSNEGRWKRREKA
jgi:hypothetical protein